MFYRRLFNYPTWPTRNPFDNLERMKRQMDQLFEDFSSPTGQGVRTGVFPLINLTEDKSSYYLHAELPGVKADDLDIQATATSIAVSGERKIPSEVDSARYHRRERDAGKFSRMIGLPTEIDADKVEANLKDGILSVVVPKAESAKPRQISVK
jgi:HSP20 family protein